MASYITVKGAGDDRKVVIWESDEAHPDGEIFVSNDGIERKVAETAAVKRKLANGELVKATDKSAPKPAADAVKPV